MDINFTNDNGYGWFKTQKEFVKGVFWDTTLNKKLEIDDILKALTEISCTKELVDWLQKIDGIFSICIVRQNRIICSVDRLRTMPIFYSVKHKTVFDESSGLEITNYSYDKEAEAQYISTGYVIGSKTMLKDVFQVQAGEVVEIDVGSDEIKKTNFFLYEHLNQSTLSEAALIEKMNRVYTRVFKRVVEELNGRTAIVPLSAGYDSRLIVHMLNKLNYMNVICFTYGKSDNWEAQISKRVARFYGYDWKFIEYKKEKMHALYKDGIDEYFHFSVNHSSCGHTQDLLAVKTLFENNLIPENSVFLPGHSGDFVAGSHIPENWRDIDAADYLHSKHCLHWKNPYGEQTLAIINEQTESLRSNPEKIELWNWRERQAKYICNSVKVYEFYGYSWLLPLWQLEIMDFWRKVPVPLKQNRNLYFKYAHDLHGVIEANPARNKLVALYERVSDIWLSRFFGNKYFYQYLFVRIEDIFRGYEVPTFINLKNRVFSCRRVGLHSLRMWCAYEKPNK